MTRHGSNGGAGGRPDTDTRRTRLVHLLRVSLVLTLTGCGLFSIRDPNPPSQGPVEHVPNDPDSVLLNFALGVENKLSGVAVLTNALADSFKFKLDPTDAQRSYGLNDVFLTRLETETGWRSFLSRSITKSEDVRIEFKTELSTRRPDGSHYLFDECPYVLLRLVSGAVRDTIAAGGIDLYLEQVDGNWSISRWEDKITGSIPTYGARIESGSGHPRP